MRKLSPLVLVLPLVALVGCGSAASTAPATTEAPVLMPSVVCMNLQKAQDLIERAGMSHSTSFDATGAGRAQILDSNWIVVSQTPATGEVITQGSARLGSVKLSEPNDCSSTSTASTIATVAPTTAKQSVTTAKPSVTTVEPPVTTVEPPVTTVEPPVTTVEPPVTTAKPPVTTAKPPVTTPSRTVTAGAFCSTAGATGQTSTGKPMVCKTSPTDTRLRWRAA